MSGEWPVRPAAVALGLLDADAALAADALMHEDAEFRREVEALRHVGDVLASVRPEYWERSVPPALDPEIAFAGRPVASRPSQGRRRGRLRLAGVGALCAALLAVGVAAGVLLDRRAGDDGDASGRAIALAPLPGDPARGAHAVLTMSTADADLVATGLPASRRGEFYELWLLGDADRAVSVATFRVGRDGRARVRFTMGADPARYRVLDVSRERDDGDLAHSGVSVLRSRAL